MTTDNIKSLFTFAVTTPAPIAAVPEGTEALPVAAPIVTHFAFKRPSRVEREDAEAYKVAQYGAFIKKGVPTLAVLSKTYSNAGGILDDATKAEFTRLREDYAKKRDAYQVAAAAKEDVAAAALLVEVDDLGRKITDIERDQLSFFDNTADRLARDKYTIYLALHMAYTRKSETEPWVPYFKGADAKGYDPVEKYASMDALEEAQDEVYIKASPILGLLALFYVLTGGNVQLDEAKAFLKDNGSDVQAT